MPGQGMKQQNKPSSIMQVQQQQQRQQHRGRSRQPLSNASNSRSLSVPHQRSLLGPSRSAAPNKSVATHRSSSSAAQSVQRRVSAAAAPTPSIQYKGGTLEDETLEMSQLTSLSQDWGTGSVSSASLQSNSKRMNNDPPLGQEALSDSSRSSTISARGIPPFNQQQQQQQGTMTTTSALAPAAAFPTPRGYGVMKNVAFRWNPNLRSRQQGMVTPTLFRPIQAQQQQRRGPPFLFSHQQHGGGRSIAQMSLAPSSISSQYSNSSQYSKNKENRGNAVGPVVHHSGGSSSICAPGSIHQQGSVQGLSQGTWSERSASTGSTTTTTRTASLALLPSLGPSQTSHSTSSNNSQSATATDDAIWHNEKRLEALIDARVHATLKGSFDNKMKEFDDLQHAFYRRITSAEDQYSEYVKVLDSKLGDATDRIHELDLKTTNLDLQVTDAFDQHKARTNDLDERSSKLEAKASQVDKMLSKVSGMLKTVEASATTVKDLAKSSVASMNQARSVLIESALPFLKKPVLEMVSTAVQDLRFSSSFLTKAAPSVSHSSVTGTPKSNGHKAFEFSDGENSLAEISVPKKSQRSRNAKTNPAVEHVTTSKSQSKPKDTVSKTETIVSKPKKRKSPAQSSSQARSPLAPLNFTSTDNKKARTSKILFSPVHSCVTPCNKDPLDFSGRGIGGGTVSTPSTTKERTIQHVTVKNRRRGRFGRERTSIMDENDDSKYSFLSG